MSVRLAIDIGGTFTDATLIDEGTGEVAIAKVLTTPTDPSEGSAGVVSTFAIETAPVSSSISVASVNVPPMSTATRTLTGTVPFGHVRGQTRV